jgi:hypothetical protein
MVCSDSWPVPWHLPQSVSIHNWTFSAYWHLPDRKHCMHSTPQSLASSSSASAKPMWLSFFYAPWSLLVWVSFKMVNYTWLVCECPWSICNKYVWWWYIEFESVISINLDQLNWNFDLSIVDLSIVNQVQMMQCHLSLIYRSVIELEENKERRTTLLMWYMNNKICLTLIYN